MLAKGIELLVGLIVAYWVAGATGLPFWVAAVAVGLGYLAMTKGLGFGGGAATAGAGIGHLWTGFKRFALWAWVFTAIMMLATRVMGVSNNYAWQSVMDPRTGLGWRPWLWPHGIATDLLIWVSVATLAGWIASRTADGNAKLAGWTFGISALFIFTMMWAPRTAEMARPKPKNGPAALLPGETQQAWADTDAAAAERGVVPTAFCTAYQWSFGPVWPCQGKLKLPKLGSDGSKTAPSQPARVPAAVPVKAPAPAPVVADPEFPTSGEGIATASAPVKAHLDPLRSHMRQSDPARYCLVGTATCIELRGTNDAARWHQMPAGNYEVTPLGAGQIDFTWK